MITNAQKKDPASARTLPGHGSTAAKDAEMNTNEDSTKSQIIQALDILKRAEDYCECASMAAQTLVRHQASPLQRVLELVLADIGDVKDMLEEIRGGEGEVAA